MLGLRSLALRIAGFWAVALILFSSTCSDAQQATSLTAAAAVANANATECSAFVDRSPWGKPRQLSGEQQDLLTADNSKYTDVTLCCGGLMRFNWTMPHGVVQLRTGICPDTFKNNPTGSLKVLSPVSPRGSATLQISQQGIFFFTSQKGDDCKEGMIFKATVIPGPGNPCNNSTSIG